MVSFWNMCDCRESRVLVHPLQPPQHGPATSRVECLSLCFLSRAHLVIKSANTHEPLITLATYSLLKVSRPHLLLLATRSSRSVIHASPLPFPHQMLHTAHIMLGVAQVRQFGPSRPLRRPLDDLDPCHIPTIYLEPHLHANPAQLAAQQNRRLNAPPPNAHQHAREGLCRALCRHHQDVTDARRILVVLGEELRTRA